MVLRILVPVQNRLLSSLDAKPLLVVLLDHSVVKRPEVIHFFLERGDIRDILGLFDVIKGLYLLKDEAFFVF